ncbi:peptidylprolyl isomerase [Neotabrizicola sp. VNH66]|uniref:peptidylprolyl isomerase n=1 Tax=Neotabrizicola sp. VNH66 TaxID=3400918 RepID=UPI003BFC2EA3
MTKQLRLGAALLLSVALTGPVLAQEQPAADAAAAPATDLTAATVVATVNGVDITLGQMIALRENLPPQYLTLPDDVLFTGIMDQLVQQEVLGQAAGELSVRDQANLTNDKRGYLSGIVINEVASAAVTDEALQAAYDAKYTNAPPIKEYNAAHILVDSKEKADELKKQLDEGADFAELAKANSLDTGSGAAGGELGWFGLGMMVKPFEDAVVAAEPGKVTDPVQSDFGWHLVLVKETRDAAKPTIDEVREELAAEIENTAVEAKINELTTAAKIEKPGAGFDPAVLKNATLID